MQLIDLSQAEQDSLTQYVHDKARLTHTTPASVARSVWADEQLLAAVIKYQRPQPPAAPEPADKRAKTKLPPPEVDIEDIRRAIAAIEPIQAPPAAVVPPAVPGPTVADIRDVIKPH